MRIRQKSCQNFITDKCIYIWEPGNKLGLLPEDLKTFEEGFYIGPVKVTFSRFAAYKIGGLYLTHSFTSVMFTEQL